MNRILIALVVALAWSAAMFGGGWAWRGDRAEGTQATQRAGATTAALQQSNQVRATEHQQAATMAQIGEKHEQDRREAEAVPDAVVADLRAGKLQLRDDLAACHTARLSGAVAGTLERDEGAQLREQIAGDLVRVGRDADDQLRAAQDVIRADRAAVSP
ncbi:hypothetical protein EA658_16635 [Pseudoxanthomonas winnipegensis]|uniref:Lysozyme n=1 Tax=Pseudoxanthomonas winnipegensis TaxID=2480810 RepID=A0ABY1WCI0_9GAMM|nr:lysis system i-spanin subunit Rz [Pseudoxanthomonas winnipegensis]TAA11290.1 hypothetical protein EA659_08050 [Pseudoxanthomonas winnipegensis]TAA18713.1 hypothetical protein EA658_16635 [Pseudoxanthomonas winnipegensis]TAH73911.1 hypothetical protein EA657_00110 [Pseudoxanthomonas winnipegensis]